MCQLQHAQACGQGLDARTAASNSASAAPVSCPMESELWTVDSSLHLPLYCIRGIHAICIEQESTVRRQPGLISSIACIADHVLTKGQSSPCTASVPTPFFPLVLFFCLVPLLCFSCVLLFSSFHIPCTDVCHACRTASSIWVQNMHDVARRCCI